MSDQSRNIRQELTEFLNVQLSKKQLSPVNWEDDTDWRDQLLLDSLSTTEFIVELEAHFDILRLKIDLESGSTFSGLLACLEAELS